MRQLRAIFVLTLRAALRERVVWSMLALVVGTLLLLPLGLRGDGTLAGELRMHIRYSTGISTALLAAMTLWVSCGAIAGELSSKRIHMLLSKPVSRATLWWGKWLAVSLLSVSLLFLCGAVTYLRVLDRVNHESVTPAERDRVFATLLTARAPEGAVPVDVSGRVQELLDEQIRSGLLPAELPEDLRPQVMRDLNLTAIALRHAVNQDERVRYDFRLSRPLREGETLQLAYQFDGASMGANRIPGTWTVGTEEEPGLISVRIEQSPAGEAVLELPHEPRLLGAGHLVVEFHNQSDARQMVFFRPRDGVRLYRPAGGFGGNLFRGLSLLAGLLALLAALGVSCGSIFSLPVACYATAMMLVMQAFSGTLNRVLEAGTTLKNPAEAGALAQIRDRLAMTLYRGMHAVLQPLNVDSPLDRVSRGVLVSPSELLQTMGLRMSFVLLLIAGFGIFLFKKREAGVAE